MISIWMFIKMATHQDKKGPGMEGNNLCFLSFIFTALKTRTELCRPK